MGKLIAILGLIIVGFFSYTRFFPSAPPIRTNPSSGVELTENYHYYQISGNTARELRASMSSNYLRDGGGTYDAYTRWYIRWDHGCECVAASCAAVHLSVRVSADYTLPRWQASSDAPASLVKKWSDYIAALTEHEKGHVRFALTSADQIVSEVRNLSGIPSCGVLDSRIEEIGQGYVRQANQEERNYDAITGHGRTQGAEFAP